MSAPRAKPTAPDSPLRARFRQELRLRGLTGKQAAQRLRVDGPAVSNFLRGLKTIGPLRIESFLSSLEPCPFCSGEAQIKSIQWDWTYTSEIKSTQYFIVICTKCNAQSALETKEKAILKWNTRVRS